MSNVDTEADVARGNHEDVLPLTNSSQTGNFIKWKRAKRQSALLHEAGYLLLGLVSLATVILLPCLASSPVRRSASKSPKRINWEEPSARCKVYPFIVDYIRKRGRQPAWGEFRATLCFRLAYQGMSNPERQDLASI